MHKAMQDEFGHAAARTMIEGVRNFVREQEDGRDRGKKKGREEMWQQWRRGEEAWESIGREMRKREGSAGSAIKGEEATIAEERGKEVGTSGGWFWQTGQQQWQQEEVEQGVMRQGQQEKVGQEAARQQQQREEEAVRQRQQQREEEAARQRQQQREEEAARQRQQQREEEEARQRQQEEGGAAAATAARRGGAAATAAAGGRCAAVASRAKGNDQEGGTTETG